MRIVLEKRDGKRVIGILLAGLCAIGNILLNGSVAALTVFLIAALILGFLCVEFDNSITLKVTFGAAFVLVPAATFFIGQIMQNISAFSVPVFCVFLNIAIILIFQLVILLASNNYRFSMATGCAASTFAMLINAYVYMFRGNALTPADLLSIRTAANVAAEYNFTPTLPMFYAISMAFVLVLGIYCLPSLTITRTKRNVLGQIGVMAICVFALLLGGPRQDAHHWQNDGAKYNGFLLNFILQIKEAFAAEPKGYSNDVIEMLESGYSEENEDSTSTPDIIVIMDESFADLDVFENELCTNAEVTPFVDSLQENTIQGYLYASVFGGSTANSEYEFLCGNSMAFLPQGSVAYQQFLSQPTYSLVAVLQERGYDCVAMHPYYSNGWMRNTVYPMMGFNETYFQDDFPQEQLIREYVSDQEMFEYIIDYHEQHDEDTPLFLFGVTMQNHGGYAYEGPNYETTTQLEGYTHDYSEAEQYLTLIHETDKAVQYLIEYYESIDRDVVIAFFGDHMPKIENEFYEELNGGAFDTLGEQMRKQMVPFFVWTNYDSEERAVPCSSINYLPVYVLEAAGIPLPPYFQFLKQIEKVIPAINAYGYYSQENDGFLTIEDASGAEAEAIKAYEILQYNNIFDKENRSEFFFGP